MDSDSGNGRFIMKEIIKMATKIEYFGYYLSLTIHTRMEKSIAK